jgi:mono/diheme cytochrome c family protein
LDHQAWKGCPRKYALAWTAILLNVAIPVALAAEPVDGQKVFARRCASCHTVQKLTAEIRKDPAATREAELLRYLERHYPPPREDRAALVAWLLKQAGS